MPTVARNAQEDERRAWDDYADRLRGLQGEAYERAEQEAWDDLQAALREVAGPSAPDDDRVG